MMQKHIVLSCCVLEEQDSYFTPIFRGDAEKSQDHRMVWVRRGLKDHLIPSPAVPRDTFHEVRSTRSGCSKLHPAWTLPGMLCEEVLTVMSAKKGQVRFVCSGKPSGKGQHSLEMCHSAAVLEWGKAEEEALYGWQGATGEERSNSCSGLLKLKRLFGPPLPSFVWI